MRAAKKKLNNRYSAICANKGKKIPARKCMSRETDEHVQMH